MSPTQEGGSPSSEGKDLQSGKCGGGDWIFPQLRKGALPESVASFSGSKWKQKENSFHQKALEKREK